jgi:hypothetical protein
MESELKCWGGWRNKARLPGRAVSMGAWRDPGGGRRSQCRGEIVHKHG